LLTKETQKVGITEQLTKYVLSARYEDLPIEVVAEA
jgi:hypothetical protein